MKRVRIPVTVTYTGYYDFEYEDTLDMDAIMNEDLAASPENKEAHWEHGLKKLQNSIKAQIEESSVYVVLNERTIACDIRVGLGVEEEKKLRAIFEEGYAELEVTPLED